MMASDGGVVAACRCNLIEALYTGWSMWTGRKSSSTFTRAVPDLCRSSIDGVAINVIFSAEC